MDPTEALSINDHNLVIPGNTSAASVALMTDSLNILAQRALTDNNLCHQFVNRAVLLNVTFMMTPSGRAAAGAVCVQRAAVVDPQSPVQPSFMPSVSLNSAPTAIRNHTKTDSTLFTSSFVCFLIVTLLIGLLRLSLSLRSSVMKAEEHPGHLYDILVVINDDEEAIIENIAHKDIAFFRRTAIENPSHSLSWLMNATSDALEKRFEVQFFDHFDLLGQSGPPQGDEDASVQHGVSRGKLFTKELYLHDAGLQMGMIIKVKPATPPLSKEMASDLSEAHQLSQLGSRSYDSVYDDIIDSDSDSSWLTRSGVVLEGESPRSRSSHRKGSAHSNASVSDYSANSRSRLSSLLFYFNDSSLNGIQSTTPRNGWDQSEGQRQGEGEGDEAADSAVNQDRHFSFESIYNLREEAYCDEYDDNDDTMSLDLPRDALTFCKRNISAKCMQDHVRLRQLMSGGKGKGRGFRGGGDSSESDAERGSVTRIPFATSALDQKKAKEKDLTRDNSSSEVLGYFPRRKVSWWSGYSKRIIEETVEQERSLEAGRDQVYEDEDEDENQSTKSDLSVFRNIHTPFDPDC